jgi:hypothetical protein
MGAVGERYLTKREFETYVRQVNKSLSSLRITQPGSAAGAVATHFTGLSDVPGSYSGQAGKVVVVNAGENALTFTNSPAFAGLALTGFSGAVRATAGVLSAGTLAVTMGGTGLASLTAGDMLYASAVNTLAALGKGTTAQYLKGGDSPSWATLNQAGVAGLTTADGPTFEHLHLVDATDGYKILLDPQVAMEYFSILSANGLYGFGWLYDGDLKLYRHENSAAGTLALTILRASGNVGIGATSPNSIVDIRSLKPYLEVRDTAAYSATPEAVLSLAGNYTVAGDRSGFGRIVGGKENATVNNWYGYLSFWTAGPGAPFEHEWMRITSSGDVGFGTPTPGSRISLGTLYSTFNNTLSFRLYENGPVVYGFGVSSGLLEIHADQNVGAIGFFTNGAQNVNISAAGKLLVFSLKSAQSHPANYKAVYVDTDTGELYRIA